MVARVGRVSRWARMLVGLGPWQTPPFVLLSDADVAPSVPPPRPHPSRWLRLGAQNVVDEPEDIGQHLDMSRSTMEPKEVQFPSGDEGDDPDPYGPAGLRIEGRTIQAYDGCPCEGTCCDCMARAASDEVHTLQELTELDESDQATHGMGGAEPDHARWSESYSDPNQFEDPDLHLG